MIQNIVIYKQRPRRRQQCILLNRGIEWLVSFQKGPSTHKGLIMAHACPYLFRLGRSNEGELAIATYFFSMITIQPLPFKW